MVKVSDCTCCDCESAAEKEQIKERALSSINKVYTFDNRTFWPDGTGMVTIPLPTQDQLNTLATVTTLTDQVAKNTAGIATNAELIAGEQTQIDSLKTTLETSYQAIVQKGSANGYAGLDNNARVPLAQLYAGTSANQVPLIGKQLLANEMLVVDADGLTVRSKPIVQTLSFRGIYPSKTALPSEGNVSGDYAIVSDGTAQADTGYYVWGYNTGTSEYEWVWTILFDANNYQLISNLVTEISDSSDDSHYPSAKAVKNYHDASVGTLEQEIDALSTDMAALQTTVGEHTAEITAVNTLANRAYDDVEISGSELTFTRGNGGYTKIDLPVQTKTYYTDGVKNIYQNADLFEHDIAQKRVTVKKEIYIALSVYYNKYFQNVVIHVLPGVYSTTAALYWNQLFYVTSSSVSYMQFYLSNTASNFGGFTIGTFYDVGSPDNLYTTHTDSSYANYCIYSIG